MPHRLNLGETALRRLARQGFPMTPRRVEALLAALPERRKRLRSSSMQASLSAWVREVLTGKKRRRTPPAVW